MYTLTAVEYFIETIASVGAFRAMIPMDAR